MAYLVSIANGNLTNAATWGEVEANSLLNSNAGSSTVSTTGASSSAFTPVACTISHIGVKMAAYVSPTTIPLISVELRSGGVLVAGTNCGSTVPWPEIGIYDYNITALHGGWIFYKLDTPVTLSAIPYTLFVKSTSTSGLNLYTNGTSSNWCRMLVTTITHTPATGDSLIVAGNINNTNGTDYNYITVIQDQDGSAGGNVYSQINICRYGTLSAATNANTHLKIGSGTVVDAALTVFGRASLVLGTESSPIEEEYNCTIEFQSTTAGQYGLNIKNFGIFTSYGAIKDHFKLLNSNVIAGSTTLLLDSQPTGWRNGDNVIVCATTATATQTDVVALTADVTTSTVSCAALTYAHSGTSPTQGEVCNLTRNVKIRGLGPSTTSCYVTAEAGATVDLNNTEVYWSGANASSTKYGGITSLVTTGSLALTNCTIHDCTGTTIRGFYTSTTSGGITLTNVIIYNTTYHGIDFTASEYIHTATNCIVVRAVGSSVYGISAQNDYDNIVNCRAIWCTAAGILLSNPGVFNGTFSGNIAHSNLGIGIQVDTLLGGTISNLTSWRNATSGVVFQPGIARVVFDNITIFENTSVGLRFINGGLGNYIFSNCNIYGNTSGIYCTNGTHDSYYFHNSTIGPNNSVADITLANNPTMANLLFNNCTFSSTTEISNPDYLSSGDLYDGIMMVGYNGNPNTHRRVLKNSIITTDSTIYKTAAPSERITPNTIISKSKSASKFINLETGDSAIVSAYVFKSNTTNYTGEQPRLILKQNHIMGITSDTVLATASAANGEWEQLTGNIPAAAVTGVVEVYVDCATTAGFICVDDWSVR